MARSYEVDLHFQIGLERRNDSKDFSEVTLQYNTNNKNIQKRLMILLAPTALPETHGQ